jgi:2-polyprenyl-3-methyl-5-hydroxy-6-metoxy-1,4-benzoquinol methylase
MLTRTNQKELEDGEVTDKKLFESSIIYKQKANRYFGNYWLIGKFVKTFISNKTSLSVLDVGTGIGDLPRFLSDRLQKENISVAITGWDNNNEVINVAKKFCKKYPNIDLLYDKDVPNFTRRYNIAIFSQVLHHLTPEEAKNALKIIFENVTDGIIISDLIRSRFAYWLVKFAVFITTTNSINRHDGPLSVLRCYNNNEIAEILAGVGIKNYKIYNFFPRKFIIITK